MGQGAWKATRPADPQRAAPDGTALCGARGYWMRTMRPLAMGCQIP